MSLVHFDRTAAESAAVVIELHVRVIRQERHGNARGGEALRDEIGGEALAKWVVMRSRLPDGDLLGFPCLGGADGDRLRRDHRDISAAAGAGVLRNGERVEINDARRELAILLRAGWLKFPAAFARGWIIE